MFIKQLTIFAENKPGRLTEIFEILASAGIDIRAVSVADSSDFGLLRLIVDQPEKAIEVMELNGIALTLTDVLAIGRDDRPGAFAASLRLLSDAGLDVEYIYAAISRKPGAAHVIIRAKDCRRAGEILRAGGVELLSPEEVYGV